MTQVMKFCPLASGSGGNCTYVGSNDTHLLVDAGLSGKRIETALSSIDVPRLDGILITHEHTDHISGAGVMSRRYNLPLYATPETWRFLLHNNTIGTVAQGLQKTITPGNQAMIGDIEVSAFNVSHDAAQPVGYCLQVGNYKAAVATDMGYVTDTVRAILKDVNIMLLESNHDIEMLQNGPYPNMLKERVVGSLGHLSNVAAGALLADIASDVISHVFLGHLSEENNRPMLALDTVQSILAANEVVIENLKVAGRHEPSEMVVL